MSVLVLAPFNQFPKVSFDDVKLGAAAVRKVTVQNPTQKKVKVALTSLPKAEAGFQVDFVDLELGPQQEATLNIGWVPRQGGNVTEKIVVKYGTGLQTRIVLVGSCLAPKSKTAKKVGVLTSRQPMLNRSAMQKTFTKKEAPPKVDLPENPVKRAEFSESPEIRDIASENMPPPPATKQLLPPPPPLPPKEQSWSPQKLSESRICGDAPSETVEDDSVFCHPSSTAKAAASEHRFKSPLKSNESNIRRETFIANKAVANSNRVVRKDTYTVKSAQRKDTYVVQQHQQQHSSSEAMSFYSSTPAGKGTESDPRFKLANISVIKNVAESSSEKRSSCKELKFPTPPCEDVAGDDHVVAELPNIRRETFIAGDNIRKEATEAVVAQEAEADQPTNAVNISDIVQNFIDLDDSQSKQKVTAGHPVPTDGVVVTEQTSVLETIEEHVAVTEEVLEVIQEEERIISGSGMIVEEAVSTTVTSKVASESQLIEQEIAQEIMQEYFANDGNQGTQPSSMQTSDTEGVSMFVNPPGDSTKNTDNIEGSVLDIPDIGTELSDSRETYVVSQSPVGEEDVLSEQLQTENDVLEGQKKKCGEVFTISVTSPKREAQVSHRTDKEQFDPSDLAIAEAGETQVLEKIFVPQRPEQREQNSDLNTPSPMNMSEMEDISMAVNYSETTRVWEETRTTDIAEAAALSDSKETYVLNQSPCRDADLSKDEEVTFNLEESNYAQEAKSDEMEAIPEVEEGQELGHNLPELGRMIPDESNPDKTNLEEASMFVNLSRATSTNSQPAPEDVSPNEELPPASLEVTEAQLSDSRDTYVLCPSPCREAEVSQEEPKESKSAGKVFTMSISPPAPAKSNKTVSHKKPLNQTAPIERKTLTRTINKSAVVVTEAHTSKTRPQAQAEGRTATTRAPRPTRQPPLARKPRPSVHRLTLIKSQRSKAAPIVRNPNPFASKNIYYDERWVEKQESGFMKWLNFVLTPDSLDDGDGAAPALAPGKLDVGKLWRACSSDVKVPRAPTREVMSMRAYTVRREMNRLRRRACTLWQTPAVARVMAKMETEVRTIYFSIFDIDFLTNIFS